MQISMKCSVAVHCLVFIYEAQGKVRVISTLLAQSTGCNPVVIRNVFGALEPDGPFRLDWDPSLPPEKREKR